MEHECFCHHCMGEPEPDDQLIIEKFEAFAKAYKYDTTVVRDVSDAGEYKRESTQKAFVAYKNGFDDAREVIAVMRKALEAVQMYGYTGDTDGGISVSYLVKKALSIT